MNMTVLFRLIGLRMFTERKSVLGQKLHHLHKYAFRLWLLCFYYVFLCFNGESTEVGYGNLMELISDG